MMNDASRDLVQIDELTMENWMRGPEVTVVEDDRLLWGKRTFISNKSGYAKYHLLFAKHECTGLSVGSEDVAENRYHEEFDVDFTKIDSSAIQVLFLRGNSRFPQAYDLSVFERMSEVRVLGTQWISLGPNLKDYFPKLQAWICTDWKTNRIKSLGSAWPDLKYLQIQGFNDSLSIFAGRDIRRLFLAAPSLKSLDDLALFPNLETLVIVGLRKGVDLGPIAKLPKLENLSIEGKPKMTGWDSFGSETVRFLQLGWAPSRAILDHFPALQHCNVWESPGERYGFGLRWAEDDSFEDPFTSVVPTNAAGC